MKNTMLFFFFNVINYFSEAMANSEDVSSAVKNYTFKDGEPYGLSQVYQVNAPDTGFPPYYIFFKLGVENAYPFIFNREGVPGKDEPYTRCNIVLNVKGKKLIPDRRYKTGYAEDSEPCLAIEKVSVIQGGKDIKWFVTESLYQSQKYHTEKTKEVYFHSGDWFCFSERIALNIAGNKISTKDLINISLGKEDFEECSK